MRAGDFTRPSANYRVGCWIRGGKALRARAGPIGAAFQRRLSGGGQGWMRMDVAQNCTAATGVNPDGRRSAMRADARLRALVLLAGSVRQSDLGRVIRRSLLDLPVEGGRTVLSMWQASAEALAADAGLDSLPIRVAIDRGA